MSEGSTLPVGASIEIKDARVVALEVVDAWPCARCGGPLRIGDMAYFNVDLRPIHADPSACPLAAGGAP